MAGNLGAWLGVVGVACEWEELLEGWGLMWCLYLWAEPGELWAGLGNEG